MNTCEDFCINMTFYSFSINNQEWDFCKDDVFFSLANDYSIAVVYKMKF